MKRRKVLMQYGKPVSKVLKRGYPITYGDHTAAPPPPPDYAVYNFVTTAGDAPPPGEAWSLDTDAHLVINGLDFYGRDESAWIAGLVNGDQFVVSSVAHTVSSPTTVVSPGVYRIHFGSAIAFPPGLHGCSVVKAPEYPDLVDTLNTAAAWMQSGTNLKEDFEGGVKFTSVDNAIAGNTRLNSTYGLSENLVVGKRYKVVATVRKDGTATCYFRSVPAAEGGAYVVTNEDTVATLYFTANSASFCELNFYYSPVGGAVYTKEMSVREAPL